MGESSSLGNPSSMWLVLRTFMAVLDPGTLDQVQAELSQAMCPVAQVHLLWQWCLVCGCADLYGTSTGDTGAYY